MDTLLAYVSIALFGGLISLVTWMATIMLKHIKSDSHQSLTERAAVAKMIDEQIKSHEALDNQRFSTIEGMLKEMRDDIKLLLTQRARTRK